MNAARGSLEFTHSEDTNTTSNPHVNGSTYCQKSFQEECTITQYKGDPGVDTRVDPNSGIKYTYDKVVDFVRNFPSGFRGCFVCVKEDFYRRYD